MPSPDTNSPAVVPDWLATKIDALGLRQNVQELVDFGYTVIRNDPEIQQLTDGVREAILKLSNEADDYVGKHGFTSGCLLDRDPVFAEAVRTPKLYALIEFLLGRSPLMSQLEGSVRAAGNPSLPLHSDSAWLPEPFPEWDMVATACWVTDDFTVEGGCTAIVPGSHKFKRRPTSQEKADQEGLVPILAPKGSICLWDGSVWHRNLDRTIPGERVVLHMTYSRIGLQPIEDYSHLDDAWLADKPAELRGLVGRDLFLGKATPHRDQGYVERLYETIKLVHGEKGFEEMAT